MTTTIKPISISSSDQVSRVLNSVPDGTTVTIHPGIYIITKDIVVTARGLTILANGVKFVQAGCNKVLHFLGCTGLMIDGLQLEGEGGTINGASTSFNGVSAIYATDPVDQTIRNVTVKNFLGGGIRWTGEADNVCVEKSTVKGIGSEGGIANSDNGNDVAIGGYMTTKDVNTRIVDNDISGHAFAVFTTRSDRLIINNNNIHDIPGQHGLYIGHAQMGSVLGNMFDSCALNAVKFQITDGLTVSESINVSGNNIRNCGSGVEFNVVPTNGVFEGGFAACKISDNLINDSGSYGVVTDNAYDCDIEHNNIVNTSKGYGILCKYFGGSIKANNISGTWWNGIHLHAREGVSLSTNTINNPAQSDGSKDYRNSYALSISKDAQTVGGDIDVSLIGNLFKGTFTGPGCVRVNQGCTLSEAANHNFTGNPLIVPAN